MPEQELLICSRREREQRQFKAKRVYEFSDVDQGEDIFNSAEKTLGCKLSQFTYYEPIEKDDKLYMRAKQQAEEPKNSIEAQREKSKRTMKTFQF